MTRRQTADPVDFVASRGGTHLALRSDVVRPSTAYEPRAPAQSVLYQIVRDHFETFRAQAGRICDGEGLPRFIEEECEGFLRCGRQFR